MNRTVIKGINRTILHAVLLAGAVLFSAPFVWLASSSAKAPDELYPPRWLPPAPAFRASSPYIALRYNEKPEQPVTVADEAWVAARGPVQAGLEKRVRAMADELPYFYRAYLEQPEIAEAVFAELLRRAPHDLFSRPVQEVVAWFAGQLDADMVRNAFNRVYRRVALADIYVYGWDSSQEHFGKVLDIPWRVVSGNVKIVPRKEGLRRQAQELHYTFKDEADFTLRAEMPLAMAVENVKKVRFMNHVDGTWHRIWLEVEMGGKRWRSETPAYTGGRGWQETTWQVASEEDRAAMVRTWLVLREAGTSDYDTPASMRLTLRYEASSPLMALANKLLFNYREVLRMVPLWGYVRNSMILVTLNIFGQILSSSLIAFAFSRLRWPGRDACFLVVLATLMLPPQVTLIPVFLIYKSLGWYNTLLPLWVPAFFGNAFYIFLLRQFMKGIPRDLEDSARIDGCGYPGIYGRIILPLIKPALAAIAIFTFMAVWNDFMGPLIFITDQELYPLSLGLFSLHATMGALGRQEIMMAASVLMTLPVIALFFAAQRHFIQGVTLTGMKG